MKASTAFRETRTCLPGPVKGVGLRGWVVKYVLRMLFCFLSVYYFWIAISFCWCLKKHHVMVNHLGLMILWYLRLSKRVLFCFHDILTPRILVTLYISITCVICGWIENFKPNGVALEMESFHIHVQNDVRLLQVQDVPLSREKQFNGRLDVFLTSSY